MESRSSEFFRAACLAMRIIFSAFRGILISLVRKSNSAEKSTLFPFSAVDFFPEKKLNDLLNDMMLNTCLVELPLVYRAVPTGNEYYGNEKESKFHKGCRVF